MFKGRNVWGFLLPGLVLLLAFYVIPFFGGIRYSFLDGSYRDLFVGFENYRTLWQNPVFLLGLKNTLVLSLICAPLLWVLSLMTASAVYGARPFGRVFRSAVLIPYLAPASAMIMVWQVFFDYGGPLNRLLSLFGAERVLWLSGPAMRIPIVIMFLWKNIGLCTVIFLSAVQGVPESLYEAGELDGIGRIRKLFSITLPLIMPSAYLIFIVSWINAFKIFREVYFIAGAYPDQAVYTLQHYINNVYGKMNYQMVTSSAYSFALISVLLFGILFLMQRRASDEIYG